MRSQHPSQRGKPSRHPQIALAQNGTTRHEAEVVMVQLNLATAQWEATPEDVRLALRQFFNPRKITGAERTSSASARRIARRISKSAEQHACAAGELDHALGDMEDALAVCLEQLSHEQIQTVLARQEIKAFHPAL